MENTFIDLAVENAALVEHRTSSGTTKRQKVIIFESVSLSFLLVSSRECAADLYHPVAASERQQMGAQVCATRKVRKTKRK